MTLVQTEPKKIYIRVDEQWWQPWANTLCYYTFDNTLADASWNHANASNVSSCTFTGAYTWSTKKVLNKPNWSYISLPATILAEGCYANMFNNCTALTTVPELPATMLAASCYTGMFTSCTALTSLPKLPAITLVDSCYR